MIAKITVGSGRKRTVIELPRDREIRRILGNKIKSHLFPSNASFKRAKERGHKAAARHASNDNNVSDARVAA